MAARKKTKKTDLALDQGNLDPRAPLDGAGLLAAAAPLMRLLAEDLLARARSSPAVLRGLDERWRGERDARRTADPFEVWQRAFVEQVAAAWLLSCVFVRTLEDRGLLVQNRIAGPGAADSQKAFFELAPSLSERDYLLTTFRKLSHLPAARDLFDRRHNPVWMLGPSVDATRALLAFFRTPSADAPTFRFGGSDTRFLGDLYQDLSEDVRKRFALLQTPLFVEEYILDRTLTRAIERFGLEQTSLIDPTCGSGHFLLGAFARLLDAFLRAEPGLDPRQAAQKALDRVAGSDINPYAVAIARFRLLLAFVEAGKYPRLSDAPEPKIHLAVADSLLHGKETGKQRTLDQQGTVTAEEIWGHVYALEDASAAHDVLGRRYAAVVGNPPYITVKDAAVREEIRDSYPRSAFRSYSLAAPFAERFFQLAKTRGAVGMITANSFMKREFGKRLIEEVLPSLNVDGIVNTSGAYIPGHGTPTVLLFGTNEPPVGADVLAVLAKRGEPSTPDDPQQGVVWRSIVDHGNELGFDNDYVSVARVARGTLAAHPWSLGGGGAAELKELLEARSDRVISDLVSMPIGRAARTGDDDAYVFPPHVATRVGIHEHWWRDLLIGESVRDWFVGSLDKMLYPYDADHELRVASAADARFLPALRHLWPVRRVLANRTTFQGKMADAGLEWFEYMQYTRSANLTPLSIAFAFVATHNHFVLDRGGKVFKQSAPVIKLAPEAHDDDYLALLAYLNSSTACFWMKQVFSPKGMHNGSESNATPFLVRFEFDGTKLARTPIPNAWPTLKPKLAALGRQMDDLARQRASVTFEGSVAAAADVPGAASAAVGRREQFLRRMVAVQEEIDWLVYESFALAAKVAFDGDASRIEMSLGQRPFEQSFSDDSALGRDWFRWHQSRAIRATPANVPPGYATVFAARLAQCQSADLSLLEAPESKRRWLQPSGKAAQQLQTDLVELQDQAESWIAAQVERCVSAQTPLFATERSLRDVFGTTTQVAAVARWLSADGPLDLDALLERYVRQEAVPFLAVYRCTESGLEKRTEWEKTWNLQRREDAGEHVGDIPVPPKYAQGDFHESHWRLRGKLNLPNERLISYPGCESDEGGERLYGWAGWDHKQRALALMTLYQERKTKDGWPRERLMPILAGLRELLPWLRQWHADVDADLGISMADYFAGLYEAERAYLAVTDQDLADWRPALRGRGRKKAPAAAKDSADEQE